MPTDPLSGLEPEPWNKERVRVHDSPVYSPATRQRPRLLRVLLLALLHDAKVLQSAEWLATLSTRSGT